MGTARSENGGSMATTFMGVAYIALLVFCLWAADGELIARVERGEVVTPGIPVRERLAALGIDWSQPTGD